MTPPRVTVRYPIEPLAALMGLSPGQALAQLGCSGSTAKEYRTIGVSERVADRLATTAGFHPSEVWPEIVDAAIDALKIECAREDCTVRFVPANRRQRYCHRNCKDVVNTRRRRQRPEVAAAAREYAARYREENYDYVVRAEAARREAKREEINDRQRARDRAAALQRQPTRATPWRSSWDVPV